MPQALVSPNTVLANALNTTIDLLRPRLALRRPKRVEFVVGTQINGTPHIGTNLTQCAAFVLAREVRNAFSVETHVTFNALDNAPYEIELDPESFHSYQLTYRHALGFEGVSELTERLYRGYFDGLSERTAVDYSLLLYSTQQATSGFRRTFLKTLPLRDQLRWCVAPSSGVTHVRLPCPTCGKAEKRGERTELMELSDGRATFRSVCFDHGGYESVVTPESEAYIDLSTLYRNVVKEAEAASNPEVLHVMVKGGDWAFACPLVDWALGILGIPAHEIPLRWFTPQIVNETGAKLSKSLIRRGEMALDRDKLWVLDTLDVDADFEDYLDSMLGLVVGLMEDPKHFFRAYSYSEIDRLMKEQPPHVRQEQRARLMRIYRKYFDMIAAGDKTIEIRVGYSSMRKIRTGQLLMFASNRETCLTKVVAVREYKSFDELFALEDPERISPGIPRDQQLQEVRRIFPRDKEALGVLAIHLERIGSE